MGPSGAGKTTIAALLSGAYAPSSGAVLLDGTELAALNQRSYRRLLGVVEQDTALL